MPIEIAVLGATGVVGQKIIGLLSGRAEFRVIEVVASEQRIGETYGDICDWRERFVPLPKEIGALKLKGVEDLKAEFVVSCLPAESAKRVEPFLASQGKKVFSNASAFRMDPTVPLLIPEINAEHLSLLETQETKGKIITNPNCSAVGATLALAPLTQLGEILHVSIVTLQSISGAGYPGIPSIDILGNTIPHIEGEAEKINEEVKRILGTPEIPLSIPVTAHVHRVPVMYGHTVTLHIMFKQGLTVNDAREAYTEWNRRYPDLFVLHEKAGRPQGTKDLSHNDMRVHIGHLRQGDQENILGLVSLTHNLVRGAAGAVIANMESYLSHLEVLHVM